ncbi:MAG: hypothetical protein ABI321_13165 [Polyangia bacterium]
MKTLLGLSLALLFAAPAHAAPARDVVRTLERGVSYAGTSRSNKSLYLPGRKIGIELRANGGIDNHGVIAIDRTWSSRGYSIGKDGRLSPADRKALAADLAKHPSMTREHVVLGVRSAIVNRRAHEVHLASADQKLDGFLAQAKLSPKSTMRLTSGRHGTIEFTQRPGGGAMLVVNKSLSQSAIFLEGDAKRGYSMTPAERAEVASIMLAN